MSMPPTVIEKELADQIAELRNEVERLTKRNAHFRQTLDEVMSFLVSMKSHTDVRIEAIGAALDSEETK